jgi:type I restriction enzyme S subunit
VKTVPLKRLVGINLQTLPETTEPGFEFRYVDIGAVSRGQLNSEPEASVFASAPSRARRLVRQGDTIISTVRTYLRAVWPVRDSATDLVVSTGFAVLTPTRSIDSRYLGWLVQSDVVVEEVVARSVGVSYPAINPSDIGTVRVPLPPLARQRSVADYLDRETARIDALIEKKQHLLGLLDERRMAVMADGVSGRFTSNRPLPSTLSWLPWRGANWREAKLTLVARLGSGHTPSRDHPEWWEECTIPWVTTGEVAQLRSDRVEFLYDTGEKISALGVANSSAKIHPKDTVVLCRTASAGYSGIMGTAMATSQDFATWTCGPLIRPRFLLLCLRAMRQDLLGRLAMGSTHKTIYMPDIEALRVPLPEVNEQDAIVDAVWRRLRTIDTVIDELHRQIDLLAEHRQALITGAVTGEFGPPGVAA